MIDLLVQRLQATRGDVEVAIKLSGRRVGLSSRRAECGFTLIELVITVTVLSILTLGIVPLMKISVKRQKEEQLRAALRQMRTAIDEFHRDTVNMNCTGTVATTGGQAERGEQEEQGEQILMLIRAARS